MKQVVSEASVKLRELTKILPEQMQAGIYCGILIRRNNSSGSIIKGNISTRAERSHTLNVFRRDSSNSAR